MVTVVGVKFKSGGKVYFFDPDDIEDLEEGSAVIVETARGLEFGTVARENTEVKEEDIVKPLKKIMRKATEEDKKIHRENESKKSEAMRICQEKVEKHGLEMKLIDVEYTFDNNKVIFYFTADGRVDFRELVKDLASEFCMRIELRQIGVRDEAKLIGGIGSCGRPLCCASWLTDFQPVSIKMAKNQDLSLNPGKISGICGRLMCCLKYENDTYQDLKKGMPRQGEKISTEDGEGIVFATCLLEGKVKVRLFTGEFDDEGRELLSDELYTYSKEDVRKGERRHRPPQNEGKGSHDKGEERRHEEKRNHKNDRKKDNRDEKNNVKDNKKPRRKKRPGKKPVKRPAKGTKE